MIATAISIFSAGCFVVAPANSQVKCAGTNACKGQGFSDVKDVIGCQSQGRHGRHSVGRPFDQDRAGVPVLR